MPTPIEITAFGSIIVAIIAVAGFSTMKAAAFSGQGADAKRRRYAAQVEARENTAVVESRRVSKTRFEDRRIDVHMGSGHSAVQQ